MSTHKWYAIRTYAGSEIAAKRTTENLVKGNGIKEQLEEMVVPTEDVIELRNEKEKINERNLRSGYVSAHLDSDTELWHRIQSFPKVSRFTGKSKKPAPLTEEDINLISEEVYNRVVPKPKISFEGGESVKITEGPFANFTAIVEEYDMVRELLELNVPIFECLTPVKTLYSQIERII